MPHENATQGKRFAGYVGERVGTRHRSHRGFLQAALGSLFNSPRRCRGNDTFMPVAKRWR